MELPPVLYDMDTLEKIVVENFQDNDAGYSDLLYVLTYIIKDGFDLSEWFLFEVPVPSMYRFGKQDGKQFLEFDICTRDFDLEKQTIEVDPYSIDRGYYLERHSNIRKAIFVSQRKLYVKG